jgi:hypothetical protein
LITPRTATLKISALPQTPLRQTTFDIRFLAIFFLTDATALMVFGSLDALLFDFADMSVFSSAGFALIDARPAGLLYIVALIATFNIVKHRHNRQNCKNQCEWYGRDVSKVLKAKGSRHPAEKKTSTRRNRILKRCLSATTL